MNVERAAVQARTLHAWLAETQASTAIGLGRLCAFARYQPRAVLSPVPTSSSFRMPSVSLGELDVVRERLVEQSLLVLVGHLATTMWHAYRTCVYFYE